MCCECTIGNTFEELKPFQFSYRNGKYFVHFENGAQNYRIGKFIDVLANTHTISLL